LRHTKISKLICSLLVCSMVFSSGLMVYAQDNSVEVDSMKSATLVRRTTTQELGGHKHGGFKAVIDKLVEEGNLSREKAEKIDQFIKQKREAEKSADNGDKQSLRKGFKYGLVNDLVNAKIINDSEAEAIKSKLREIKEQKLNEKLNSLIQNGTITQTQADKVKTYFINSRLEKEEQFKKIQNMTEEQRKVYFMEHKKDSLMEELVEDGVLTQEQAQELRKSMREGHEDKCKDN
jgi:polyhydroxyalkanoate synthesis regulator phasin